MDLLKKQISQLFFILKQLNLSIMIQFKDVAHFYLGCDVELDNSGSKVIKKLVAVGGYEDEPYVKLRLGTPEKGFVHAVLIKENRIKPILRSLSDMTEEEYHTIWYDMNLTAPVLHDKLEMKPEMMLYLLKQSFDLFGLIKSDQAIDSKTIKP